MGVTMVLSLLCGVALFLFGMSLMGDGLKKVAGNKLENILYRLTNSPVKGVLLGAAVTSIIQSSSAATVMVVGFVNSGMMKVSQAIGVIMGANIGTSITGWILCLSYIEGSSGIAKILSTSTITALVAIVGIIFKMFVKKSVFRNLGDIMLGFAILMVGMQNMSGAVAPLKESETFIQMITMFSNPIMGILIGTLFTAVLQSSSAAVGILQALSMTGVVTFASALPMIMGIGVGAACPVLLSAIGTNKNGKRTAIIYLINDLFGMIIWSVVFYSANAILHFDFMTMIMTPVSTAMMNTVFRTATMIVLLPFIKYLEKLVFFLIKNTPEDDADSEDFDLLSERYLSQPDVAINQSHLVMHGMVKKVEKNINRSIELLSAFSWEQYNKIQDRTLVIEKYDDKLGNYLNQLNGKEMNPELTKRVSKLLHTVSDFEHMGQHARNVAMVADELYEKKKYFSEDARQGLSDLKNSIKEIVAVTSEAFQQDDLEKAKKVESMRAAISVMCDELKICHIERMQGGKCDIKMGFAFNNLLNNLERIADYCQNVSESMIELSSKKI